MCRTTPFAADAVVASATADIVLQQPESHADADQNRRKACRTAEVNWGCCRIAVNVGGEYIKTDTPSQSVRGSVFGKGLDEDQQGGNSIIAAEQRGKDLPQAQTGACAENGCTFFQTGGDVQHGIFEQACKKGKDVQTHYQDKPGQAEKSFRPGSCCRKKLLEKSPFLHE